MSKVKKSRKRYRTYSIAPHDDNPKLFKWSMNKRNHLFKYSDESLCEIAKDFKYKGKHSSSKDDFYKIYVVFQRYFYGTRQPRVKFHSYGDIFKNSKKYTERHLSDLIGYHLMLRLDIFSMIDSVKNQILKQKRIPKEKRHFKIPDVPHFAFILHNKDKSLNPDQSISLVVPHTQCSIHFSRPVTLKQVTHWLGMASSNDVEHGKQTSNAEENSVAYLTHIKQPYDSKTYLKKYHYDYKDVRANFNYLKMRKRCLHNWLAYRGKLISNHYNASFPEFKMKIALGQISRNDILNDNKLFAMYATHQQSIENVFKARKSREKKLGLNKYRYDANNHKFHRTVVFIYGSGGTGKSYMAKHAGLLLEKMDNRFHYQRLHGDDMKSIFKKYKLPNNVVALDDIRPNAMTYDDFIGFANQVSQRVLNNVVDFLGRAVFITEPKSLGWFCQNLRQSKDENKSQAFRRMDFVIHAVKARDDFGNIIYLPPDKNGKRYPKRLARVYTIRQTKKPVVYGSGKHSFSCEYAFYPNPKVNRILGRYSLISQTGAIKMIAYRVNHDNDSKIKHTDDVPLISSKDYMKPTRFEMTRLNKDIKKGVPSAQRIKDRLKSFEDGTLSDLRADENAESSVSNELPF